jgi:hypothetical protein
MKLILFALSAMLFISLNEVGTENRPIVKILRDTDGITIIEAAVAVDSGKAVVHIMMRPELKRRKHIYWNSKDQDNAIRDHVTEIRGGVATIVVLPAGKAGGLQEISIKGYGPCTR